MIEHQGSFFRFLNFNRILSDEWLVHIRLLMILRIFCTCLILLTFISCCTQGYLLLLHRWLLLLVSLSIWLQCKNSKSEENQPKRNSDEHLFDKVNSRHSPLHILQEVSLAAPLIHYRDNRHEYKTHHHRKEDNHQHRQLEVKVNRFVVLALRVKIS